MKRFIKNILKVIFKILKVITPSFIKIKIKYYIINHYAQQQNEAIQRMKNDSALHIAVILHGGYGDMITLSAWIKELYRRIECDVKIDIYALPQHHIIFHLMPYKIKLLNKDLFEHSFYYDLKLEIVHFINIKHYVPFRIYDKDKKLFNLLEEINIFNNKYNKYFYSQSSLDGEWANLMVNFGRDRRSELNIDGKLDFDHTKGLLHLDIDKYSIMEKLGLNNKQYITIHNGSEAVLNHNNYSYQIKIWPENHYNELCKMIKQHYPDILIVQLGAKYSIPINTADRNYINKLSMPESMIILKHSLLHIDGDSGLVHIRRQLHGKNIVLFGPTPIKYFSYPEDININSPYHCTNCMWMLKDWYFICAASNSGYPVKCMEAITPLMVFNEFKKYINPKLERKEKIIQSDLEIFNSCSLKKYDAILTDICGVFNIEKLPVSEHIYYGIEKFFIHASRQWEYPFAVDKINKYSENINKNKIKIADIGGGGGIIAPYLLRLGYDTTVFDINFTREYDGDLHRTEKLRLRWAEANDLKIEYGSIHNIPAEDETFDIVICISVMEYIFEKIYAFKEMLRILKHNGMLILTFNLVNNDTEKNILSPGLIQNILNELGILEIINYSFSDIKKSLDDIQNEKVNIPAGTTVGGFVLKKVIL